MGRYQKIEFKNFERGEIQKKYSTLPEIAYANKIAINDNKRIELQKLFEQLTIVDCYLYSTDFKIGGEYNKTGYFYFFTQKDVAGVWHAVLYKTDGAGAATLVKDFGEGAPEQIIMHKNRIIVQFDNATSGNFEWLQATSLTGAWTEIVGMRGKLMLDYAILNDNIYVTENAGSLSTGKSDVYVSVDGGVSFSLLDNDAPVQRIYSCGGFLYGRYRDFYVRENNAWRLVQKDAPTNIHFVDDEIRAVDYHNIYVFNGDKFVVKREFEANEFLSFIGNSKTKTYFKIWQDAGGGNSNWYIYSYDEKDVLLKEVDFLAKNGDWSIFAIFFADTTDFILAQNGTDQILEIWQNYNKKYVSLGDFQTTIIDEGEIVPKQIILRHDPLLTGTSVKVYTKKDQASVWSAVILTSNTVGATKKKYTYPAGAIHDFTEFKIELITTDATKTAKNVQLSFIFLPIGLENSK